MSKCARIGRSARDRLWMLSVAVQCSPSQHPQTTNPPRHVLGRFSRLSPNRIGSHRSRWRNDLRERHRSEAVRAKKCPRAPARRRFSLTQVLRHSRFQPRRRIEQNRPTTESRQHQEGFPPGHTADITAAQRRWLVSPSPLHTPPPDIRAGQRPTKSDQHCGEGQNLPAHSRRTSTPPTR